MTIHELESLANEICETQQTTRDKLCRMIRAYCKIINAREPGKFTPRALEYGDEDGHWDNSYPPKMEYKNRSGPRSLKIIENSTSDIATSGGFYYDWRRVTEDPGLYVQFDGALLGCTESGTGHLGQFAAHPGDCGVQVTREFDLLNPDDVPLDRLEKAEKELRALAFPLIAARQAELTNK